VSKGNFYLLSKGKQRIK